MSEMEEESSELVNDAAKSMSKEVNKRLSEFFGSWAIGWLDSTPWIMKSRVNNILKTANTFEDIASELNLNEEQKSSIKVKFGIGWMDAASLEDEPTLQLMWAKLLGQACLDGTGGADTYVYIDLLRKLSPIDARLIRAIRGVDHFHIHTQAHGESNKEAQDDKSLTRLIDLEGFSDMSIESLYESARRLQLCGLLRNGWGGTDCFHATASLEALLQKIEPQGFPVFGSKCD